MVLAGQLRPGAKPLSPGKSGHNETFLGVVTVEDERTVSAYVKPLGDKALFNELLGAELARRIGLMVPDGYVVQVHREHYPQARCFNATGCERFVLAYASEEQSYQNLKEHLLRTGCPPATSLRRQTTDWVAAMVFDEWIANGGRDLQDALLDDSGRLWLIDNEQALTGSNWETFDLNFGCYTSNQLAELLGQCLSPNEVAGVCSQVETTAGRIAEVQLDSALSDCHADVLLAPDEVEAVKSFLDRRRQNLPQMLTDRLRL